MWYHFFFFELLPIQYICYNLLFQKNEIKLPQRMFYLGIFRGNKYWNFIFFIPGWILSSNHHRNSFWCTSPGQRIGKWRQFFGTTLGLFDNQRSFGASRKRGSQFMWHQSKLITPKSLDLMNMVFRPLFVH